MAASCTAAEAKWSFTCSYFPLWEKSQGKNISFGSRLCCLRGWLIQLKSNCSSYPFQCPNLFFFFFFLQWCIESFPLVTCTSTKALSSLGACVREYVSRDSETKAEKSWSWFTGHCRVHSQDQGLYAYYLTHKWASLFLHPLVYSVGSNSSHQGISVYEWMPNHWAGVGGT